jgi:hypothetical protein
MKIEKDKSRENVDLKSHSIDLVFENENKPLPYSNELLKKLNIPSNDKKSTRSKDSRANS